LENGTYTYESDETWITQKITTKTSIRIMYRHYEKIEIIESRAGDYPRLNDELNWMDKFISKSYGKYRISNDTAYFHLEKAGAREVWSIDKSHIGNIQGNPLEFGPEDVPYTHSFPEPKIELIEVSDSGFTFKNYGVGGHHVFRKIKL
jgi:hypothetical protein